MTLDLGWEGVLEVTGINNNAQSSSPLDGLQREGPDINNQDLMRLHFLLWKNGGRLNKRHRGLIGGPVETDSS